MPVYYDEPLDGTSYDIKSGQDHGKDAGALDEETADESIARYHYLQAALGLPPACSGEAN